MTLRSILFWSTAVLGAVMAAALAQPNVPGTATLEHGLGPVVVTEPL